MVFSRKYTQRKENAQNMPNMKIELEEVSKKFRFRLQV